ncbi:hypothetical protein OFDDKENP_00090 [Aeromonas phage B614]|nr:hypothetical protein OFDDKENP_00090 [Aeromonas phage B614]UYD58183.1 hypothetical protein JNEOFJEA_00086 [Aeromonas phage UP87]UYD58546.1 hypothetical protein IPAKJDPM_00203 [Aeromonas phage avDM14-QBC]UYD58761.1 hypothetical protein HNNIDBEH_00168 [Aeromonas phage avDM10-HWA]UYD58935.1 hypothetical protein OFOPOMKI_00085 [Aeromonas phage avDM7-IJDJ]UYD59994.1 hypothetical protein LEHPIFIF_00238 [Aeromonas phage avDM9-HANS]
MKLIRFKFKNKEMRDEYVSRFKRHSWAANIDIKTPLIGRINKHGQIRNVFDSKTLRKMTSTKGAWLPMASFEFNKFCEKVD